MADTFICYQKDIITIAAELGIEIQVTTNVNHAVHRPESSSKLDPDIIYLFAPDKQFETRNCPGKPVDALLRYCGKTIVIEWGSQFTKASVRKILTDPHNPECIICYEKMYGNIVACPQCNASLCLTCVLKLALTPKTVQNILDGDFMMRAKCVECRTELGRDVRLIYHTVMDQLQEFPKEQQQILSHLKATNPSFESRVLKWKAMVAAARDVQDKCLRKGRRVTLQKLKKKDWNGQKAIIIGERNVSNNVIRWPIQLLNRSKAKAQIKQCNLKKI